MSRDNLFSLNRFPGYDKIEGGFRANYGINFTLKNPKGAKISSSIGRVYRSYKQTLFDITSLSNGIVVSEITSLMHRLLPVDHLLANSFSLKLGQNKIGTEGAQALNESKTLQNLIHPIFGFY